MEIANENTMILDNRSFVSDMFSNLTCSI